ncbi:MAG: lipid-A-disaccharide synthase [Pseudoxanthomonas sp.]
MRGKLRVALCAGEASGDALGAGLIAELRERFPDAEFAGIGGERMRAAGCETWFDAGELSVMGYVEVLKQLPRLLRVRREFREHILAWRPDVFVGIDAPDFNLGVEAWLKRRGLRTVHYVSPSVWAWKEKRAEKIGASAERVLCLFPMEPAIYAKHGVDARFVGHPMADAIPLEPDRAQARRDLGLPDAATVLAVLPGSRMSEVSRLAEPFLGAARLVAAATPSLHVVVPAANARIKALLEQALAAQSAGPSGFPDNATVAVLDGQAREAMIASDAVMLASGTATLEAMLCKRPMVVGYRISPLTYKAVMALGLIKVDRYALPNVLSGEDLAPELIQDDCTPEKLSAAILRWLHDPQAVAALLPRYRELHLQLKRDASARAAEAVAELAASGPGSDETP